MLRIVARRRVCIMAAMEREPDGRQVEQAAMSAMLLSLMDEHPMPWRIEQDWSAEIYDANNQRFLTPSSTAAAEHIVQIATEFYIELEKVDEESQSIAEGAHDILAVGPEWRDD